MFQIDLRGGKGAIYQQLKDEVIRLCSMGILTSDDQLPSVRALARELGINPNTVAKAYQELVQLRMERSEDTLQELGNLLHPPLSKSGVAYRMRRIETFAKEKLVRLEKESCEEK